MSEVLLEVKDLKTRFRSRGSLVHAVNGVSFHLKRGETLGVVGESGCGKTVTMLSLLRLLPPAAQVESGSALFEGQDLLKMNFRQIQKVRGGKIGLIFQDPMTSFNPVLTIGDQVGKSLIYHRHASKEVALERAVELLRLVGIPDPEQRVKDYPHQFSGGMRQRAMIAMALACEPELIIADEPTTALDVTIQAQIVELVKDLRDRLGVAIIWITHDLSLVAGLADRIMVMYAGTIVEESTVEELFDDPRHPYTLGLLSALPGVPGRKERPPPGLHPRLPARFAQTAHFLPIFPALFLCCGTLPIRITHITTGRRWKRFQPPHGLFCRYSRKERRGMNTTSQPLIRAVNLVKNFPVRLGAYGEKKAVVHAVNNVSFEIQAGETLGLVGESGCGKSTTGFTFLQLHRPTSGKCYFKDTDLTALSENELRPYRRKIQIIFQDPYSTLNPRMTIGAALAEPILAHKLATKETVTERVVTLLKDVGLSEKALNRYPHEFSGGQRQRICIARALACEPEFIVCDEPISALDVSIQAQIINLMQDLQEKYNLTYLFIAHDLSVVKHICNRVGVMYLGRMAEMGTKEQIFSEPKHPYTQALLSAVPVPNPHIEKTRKRQVLGGDVPSAIEPPSGCHFHPRCPIAVDRCKTEAPEWRQMDDGRWVACHKA